MCWLPPTVGTFATCSAAGPHDQLTPLAFSGLSAQLSEPPRIAAHGAASLADFDAILVRTMPPGSLEQVVFRMDALQRLAAAGTRVINPPRVWRSPSTSTWRRLCCKRPACPSRGRLSVRHSRMQWTPLWRWDVTRSSNPCSAARVEASRGSPTKPSPGGSAKALTQVGAVLYLQEFIRHEGWDLRLLVLGDEVHAIRRSNPADWRTNVSRGAKAEPLSPDAALVDLARRTAVAVQAPLAGVDILYGPGRQPYVLEVNAVPGWRGLARALQIDIAARVLNWLRTM